MAISRDQDWNQAVKKIQKLDPRLKPWIKRLGGVPDFKIENQLPPYEFLVRSIIGQQISGAAARAIVGRFLNHFPKKKVNFETLLRMTDAELRPYGLSANKSLSLRDLAAKIVSNELPPERTFKHMNDEKIIELLTPVRGIGVWTVQMLLIFRLNRMDVFPHADLVVKKGFMKVHGKELGRHQPPKPRNMIEQSEIWKPYRTVASKLFWAMNDLD